MSDVVRAATVGATAGFSGLVGAFAAFVVIDQTVKETRRRTKSKAARPAQQERQLSVVRS